MRHAAPVELDSTIYDRSRKINRGEPHLGIPLNRLISSIDSTTVFLLQAVLDSSDDLYDQC